jgi:hypothetical protein
VRNLYATVVVIALVVIYAAIRLVSYAQHASKAGLSGPAWWRRRFR